jgi:hypothetical protein
MISEAEVERFKIKYGLTSDVETLFFVIREIAKYSSQTKVTKKIMNGDSHD